MAEALQRLLGDQVIDPEEDTFLVFSQDIPSQSLGFIDRKGATLDLSVAGKDLTIHHNRSLLASDRKQGTTGAVVWKVTPPFAEWITAPSNVLSKAGYLSCDTVALELGAGVSGIVAVALGPLVKRYIATDQDYVLRILKQNIVENLPVDPPTTARKAATSRSKRAQPLAQRASPTSSIETLQLDWELDSVATLPHLLGQDANHPDGVDLVIACDTVYNDMLIEPFNNMCAQICSLRPASPEEKPTLCVVAQQLRSPEIFESWLKSFHCLFHVWQVPEEHLAPSLRQSAGFIVYVGILRR